MDYKAYVESLAISGQDQYFFNSGPIHAAIVMSRIFKYSHNTIKIYCGGFNGTVSNDEQYLKYAKQFLEKGGKLKILVEKDLSNAGLSNIYAILKKNSANVEMYRAQINVVNTTTNDPVHFAVGDDKMLRLETGVEDYTAEVNFGNPEKAKHLSSLFDQVWNASKANRINLSN
jgi:hypothetical protein